MPRKTNTQKMIKRKFMKKHLPANQKEITGTDVLAGLLTFAIIYGFFLWANFQQA